MFWADRRKLPLWIAHSPRDAIGFDLRNALFYLPLSRMIKYLISTPNNFAYVEVNLRCVEPRPEAAFLNYILVRCV